MMPSRRSKNTNNECDFTKIFARLIPVRHSMEAQVPITTLKLHQLY